ncbi:MAG: hypothetical protein HYR75_00255 [Gemmatimonadetes bacterium]|nr:hypothetical protein [Gemmatimonadota bacterium]MBI3569413.1 hypothetical protein [Gemmatimonadota bacterium]
MDVLVQLEEASESAAFARVNSVRGLRFSDRTSRDVVTLFGIPSPESLALALAASLESRRAIAPGSGHPDAARCLGVFAGRGAVGNTEWRDQSTGQLVTNNLEIPLAVLVETSGAILRDCGQAIGRLLAGLLMPDWPEGTSRALTFSFASSSAAVLVPTEAMMARLREADGFTFAGEDD